MHSYSIGTDISEFEIYSDNSFKINKFLILGTNDLENATTNKLTGYGGHKKIILPISVTSIKSIFITHIDWDKSNYTTFNADFKDNVVYLYYKTEEEWNSWFAANVVIYGLI